jgi:voltage-gated potassium channel
VIMFGSLTVAILIASLAGLLVEVDIDQVFGSRKLEQKIKQLHNHVIICGYGRMGRLLVNRLTELGVPLVIVERDPQRTEDMLASEQPYIVGDATEERILERAGIDRARSLVAALASDADNLFVTLTARQMRAELYIISRAEDAGSVSKLRRAGADRVISPQHIGAEWIANVLTRPNVVDFVDMASKGGELEMAEIAIPADSPLAGRSLRQADVRKLSDVIVVAIRRADGTRRFNPGADEIVSPGDVLITVGETGAAARLSALRSGHFGDNS